MLKKLFPIFLDLQIYNMTRPRCELFHDWTKKVTEFSSMENQFSPVFNIIFVTFTKWGKFLLFTSNLLYIHKFTLILTFFS